MGTLFHTLLSTVESGSPSDILTFLFTACYEGRFPNSAEPGLDSRVHLLLAREIRGVVRNDIFRKKR